MAALLVSSGCKKNKPLAGIFTPPQVAAKTPPEPVDIDPVEVPPDLNTGTQPQFPIASVTPELPPAPPKPAPVKPVKPPTPPAVAETAPPSPPPAKPVAILPADQQRQLLAEYEAHVQRTRAALSRVEGKNLTPELAEMARDARNFLALAEQERSRDLPTAAGLAERAERYATNLLTLLP